LKVVFDTNIWVSILLFPGRTATFIDLLLEKEWTIKIVHSTFIELEFLRVAEKKAKISLSESEVLLEGIRKLSQLVNPTTPLPTLCRDQDDNHILQLCETVQADILLTGDPDLLVMVQYLTTRILSPAQLTAEMGLA
jgi:uncharacterized protein